MELPHLALRDVKPRENHPTGHRYVSEVVVTIDGQDIVVTTVYSALKDDYSGTDFDAAQVAMFDVGGILVIRTRQVSYNHYNRVPPYSQSEKLLESRDGGRTWTDRTESVPGTPVAVLEDGDFSPWLEGKAFRRR